MRFPLITPASISHVILGILFILSINYHSSAQSRTELESQQRDLLAQIKKTSSLLAANTKDLEKSETKLALMQKQIRDRKSLINSYDKQIKMADRQLVVLHNEVETLEMQQQNILDTYSQAMRSMYRLNQTQNRWLFLLSGTSFNQIFLRWRYLSQVRRSWSRQLTRLEATTDSLVTRRIQVEAERQRKIELKGELSSEQKRLDSDIQKQNQILASLQMDEKKLRNQLADYRRTREKLNAAIRAMIEAKVGPSVVADLPETPASKRLSDRFSDNKGKLPWPVDRGIITKSFGKQRHPTLPNVTISNNGIDIKTSPDAIVTAIFEGKVLGIQHIPGVDHLVIVQHGKFYTVYSFLSEIFVTPGERIRAGEVLGTARPKDGLSEVHLEIWNGRELTDPQSWLVRE